MKQIIYILALVLITLPGFAQEDLDTKVFENPITQNTNIVRRKSIKLIDGFHVTGAVGFTAKIDPALVNSANVNLSSNSTGTISNSNMNYIYVVEPQTPVSSVDMLTVGSGMDLKNYKASVQYFDGLGRPIQAIQIGASRDGNDIVQPIKYDDFGRQAEEFLPYTAQSAAGTYIPTATTDVTGYYSSHKGDANPISKKIFDGSPLNRVMKQGAPGVDWQVKSTSPDRASNENIVSFKYLTNIEDDVNRYSVSGDVVSKPGTYAANQLYITETTDENKNVSREYKDKLGQVVLKESILGNTKVRTYYVYDDFGLLRKVIPPEANGDHTKDKLCYTYKYDSRKRMIVKEIPGMKPVYMVYDKRDNLVATQDGELRKQNKWNYTKYDKFSRPVETGIFTDATHIGQDAMQTEVYKETDLWETRTGDSYDNEAFPKISGRDILTKTFYDNKMTTLGSKFDFVADAGIGQVDADKVEDTKTFTIASMVKTLPREGEDAKLLWTVNYYDKKGRVIQTVSKNHLDGYDRISTVYDFVGKVLKTSHKHTINDDAQNTIENTIINEMTYDHAGRLLNTKETYKNGSITKSHTLTNEYNELGELEEKGLGGAEKLNYAYNIRGWMNSIKSAKTSLFDFNLAYNSGSAPQYNGNISSITWKTNKNNAITNSYSFSYDALNRLTDAVFSGHGNYSVSGITYDLNGNILTLNRKGQTGGSKDVPISDFIDQLAYNYSGNKLTRVQDGIDDNSFVEKGFLDKEKSSNYNINTVGTWEYRYDDNGNMTKDLNKGVDSVQYNLLNLPKKVSVTDGYIDYTYSAAGIKLTKYAKSTDDDVIVTPYDLVQKTTEYVGNYIYDGDHNLKYIITSEGRLVFNGNTPTFEYNIKDHLGNTRLVLNESGTVLQENSYYPFGMTMNAHSYTDNIFNTNRYLYNGKEKEEEFGLGWLDYGARMYDAALGRTTTTDPHMESYYTISPYSFFANNPLSFIDPTGKDIFFWILESDGDGGWKARKKVSFDDLDKKTKAGIMTFLQTDMGKEFFAQFANKGDKIGDVEFTKDGKYSNHSFNLTSIDGANVGAEGTAYEPSLITGLYGPLNKNQKTMDKAIFDISMLSPYWMENSDINYPETLGHELFLHISQYFDKYMEQLENVGAESAKSVYSKFRKNNYKGYRDHFAMADKTRRSSLYYKFINQLKSVLNPQAVEKHVQMERNKTRAAAIRDKRKSNR